MTLLKQTLFGVFTRFKVKRNTNFTDTVYYCCSSRLRLSETCWFVQSSLFWEASCALIGQLSSALWLAEYLKRETEMLRPLLYCDTVFRPGDTKTIKLIINKVFVASSGDIITDYNDLYCLFTSHVASRCVKKLPCLHLWSEKLQTTRTTLHSSKLTLNRQWQIL